MGTRPVLAAALAGIPIGIQRHGVWAGRRQMLIRFAGPAETATMYTSEALATKTPVIADTDGQRPEAIAVLHPYVQLVQVSLEAPSPEATVERAMETIRTAARVGCQHAVVIAGTDEASDADYLQIVEKAHSASDAVRIVIHPGPATERGALDRRWSVLVEHAMGHHPDVRVALRLNGPATMR